MEENHGGRNFLRGVRSDIKTLLTNFEKTGSLRFADFCGEWKRMSFSLIFLYRKTLPEILEFSEEVIHIAKCYLASPWKFHIRVGALYVLYGLFFKQPLKGMAKIRMTKEEWMDLNGLIEKCKEEKHYDTVFVHLKLCIHGAYTFTIVARAMGLEKGYRKYEEKCKTKKNNFKDMAMDRKSAVEPGLLDNLISLERLYSEQKEKVLGKKNLDFVDKTFGLSLKRKMDDFYSEFGTSDQSTAFEDNYRVSEAGKSLGPSHVTSAPKTIVDKLKMRVASNSGATNEVSGPKANKSRNSKRTTKEIECDEDEEEEENEVVDSPHGDCSLPML